MKKRFFKRTVSLNKLFRIMRITNLIFFISFITLNGLFAIGYSQNITIDVKNYKLEKIFKEIEKQSDYVIFYNDNQINAKQKVSVSIESKDVEEVMDNVLHSLDYDYKIIDNQVVVTRKEVKEKLLPAQSNPVQAEDKEVKGKVTDETTNEGLPFVNVSVKGTTIGTTTDLDGNYSLSVPADAATLIFSFVGYTSKELPISGNVLDVQMTEDIANLEEVVVTGYMTQKKSDLTGAVAVVEVDELTKEPVAGVDQMLNGKVAGVTIASTKSPGGGVAVRIRGFGTILSNDPLYIVDGVPVTEGINLINPSDIASMQILKDASAASIYGSRAANGVIIITTKNGKMGDPTIAFDAYVGVQNARNLPTQLTAQQYGEKLWEANANDGVAATSSVYGTGATPTIPAFLDAAQKVPSANTNWLDEIMQKAIIQSYNLRISNATDKTRQFFSLNYFSQEGVVKTTDFERVTGRMNTSHKLFDRLTIGENFTAAYSWNSRINDNSLLGSPIYDAFRMPSISPVYDNDGNFAGDYLGDVQNPLGSLIRGKDNKLKKLNFFGNVFAELELITGLFIKTSFGVNYTNADEKTFNPKYSEPNTQRNNSELSRFKRDRFSWTWTNILNYKKIFAEKHNVDAIIGYEAIEENYNWISGFRNDFPTDDVNSQVLSAGDPGTQLNDGTRSESSLLSLFGKINYNFENKYFLSLTYRKDGSSKLGFDKWDTFPAASVGWKISEEDFFQSDLFNHLKFRAGWGQLGNQALPDYQAKEGFRSNLYYSNYDITGSQGSVVQGLTPSRVPNPYLEWEVSTQTNFGVDATLLDNRINLTADYFIKNTEKLLYNKSLSPLYGGTNGTIWVNVGEMQNKGFELSATYQNKRSNEITFDIELNFSMIDNELVSFAKETSFLGVDPQVLHSTNFDQVVSQTSVGQPIASFYGYIMEGIFQTDAEINAHATQSNGNVVPGDIKYKDIDGNGVIDPEDRTFIGSPHPDFTYGINFNAKYKNFDLFMFFKGNQGNDIYDLSRYYSDFYKLTAYNKNDRTLNAWSSNNTGANVPRLTVNDPNDNSRPSSYYVQDGSYLKFKNLQIGYTLPEELASKIKSQKMRIYLGIANLFTLTDYDGMDPEIGLQNYVSGDRNLDLGVDRGIYPASRTFTLGVNFIF